MKARVALAFAFAFALLAAPVAAQVEIRGITVMPPGQKGTGGIVLKSVLSTGLPGTVGALFESGGAAVAVFDGGRHFVLAYASARVLRAPIEPGAPKRPALADPPELVGSADLDGDGRLERVLADAAGRVSVERAGPGGWVKIASASGYVAYRQDAAAPVRALLIDVMRAGRPQIVVAARERNCLDVLALEGDVLRRVGALTCGAPLVGDLVVADVDDDGRDDVVAARQRSQIEMFLR